MPPANPHTAEQPAAKIVTDAASIFQVPGRVTRPKRLAIVLRGLPGSGKSFVAKRLKDIEVEQGGDAPRIHALDDYFYTVRWQLCWLMFTTAILDLDESRLCMHTQHRQHRLHLSNSSDLLRH